MSNTELCYQPATELAAAIRARRVSPVEVVEAVLERISRLNPVLNAYCAVTADAARAQAHAAEAAVQRGEELGPLHGVPISIKDLIVTQGVRTTRGSRLFADDVPGEDAPVVERVKRAGAIILGKTNTPEFGWMGVTHNLVFGATSNPWDLSRSPGGSTGGGSAAVAAGLGQLTIGTDGGGSIRIPSSFAGIFGIKPSLGRVPAYPASPTGSLSHTGPMARTVADAALLLDVLAGPDERDRFSLPAAGISFHAAAVAGARDERGQGGRGLRVAWSANLGYAAVEPEVRLIAEAAALRFADLGCVVEESHPGFADPRPAFLRLMYGGIGAMLQTQPTGWQQLVDPGLLAAVEDARCTGFEYVQATFASAAVWEAMRRLFTRFDLLLTPTVAVPPLPLGVEGPSEIVGRPAGRLEWTPFTFPFNMTGLPAATVPAGFTRAGLPIGLQIIGRRHDDAAVLRAAAAFEAAFPWADRRPPIEAVTGGQA